MKYIKVLQRIPVTRRELKTRNLQITMRAIGQHIDDANFLRTVFPVEDWQETQHLSTNKRRNLMRRTFHLRCSYY